MKDIHEITSKVIANLINELVTQADANNIERDELIEHCTIVLCDVAVSCDFSDYEVVDTPKANKNIDKLADEILHVKKRFNRACKEFGKDDPITLDIFSYACGMVKAFKTVYEKSFKRYITEKYHESEED